MNADSKTRCGWAESGPLEREYHDAEWGRPVHDDLALFERLNLECMQAGLSWSLILKKREALLRAFEGFDPQKLLLFDEQKVEALLADPGIIRNRLKVNATIANAHAYFRVAEQFGSLDAFLWGYVGGKPIVNHWRSMEEVPATTPLSDRISKDMKKLGFKFVGSTVVYAFMQSVGMVDDHIESCFVRRDLY